MTDLRDRVIEAMAHALWNERFPSDNWTEKAEAALDAALGVLGTLDQQEKFSTPAVRLLLQRLRDSGKGDS